MRPRVRSYGESSTATLSPARIRMKFLRILPDTCASTCCLPSSSTLNMAFGSGSITVAITSIASSLDIHLQEQILFLLLRGQHQRPIFGHGDAMLEVGAEAAIF